MDRKGNLFIRTTRAVWKMNLKNDKIPKICTSSCISGGWYLCCARDSVYYFNVKGLFRLFPESEDVVKVKLDSELDGPMGLVYHQGYMYFSDSTSINKIKLEL
mmetsp:Transcript_6695/g.7308  ORF Transcript_6695/g.7308 Transcript_6695/m.7308 type:complete len:103 (-) Transcript_6695:49-357(-)